YIVPKGSIAIDGISLTVNDVYNESFRLTIIPITLRDTLMGRYKKGTKVNIETDMFARYISHIMKFQNSAKSTSWSDIDSISMSY
ncbi:MAG: riboflavin synthase, partial [Epsilonproteobacteria bacterium]|nr:riboflavin synthase [Campylobacterota bacterium]